MTFSSKQASKNANPVWISSGNLDTTIIKLSHLEHTVNPQVKRGLGRFNIKSHCIQPIISLFLMLLSGPFNDIITFLDKMFLKGFHFFSYEGRFKKRDSCILKGVGCTSVKITSRTGDGFNEILVLVRKWKEGLSVLWPSRFATLGGGRFWWVRWWWSMGPESYNELVWVSTSSTSMSLVCRVRIGMCTFDEGSRTDCFSIAALSIKISRVEFINNLLSESSWGFIPRYMYHGKDLGLPWVRHLQWLGR